MGTENELSQADIEAANGEAADTQAKSEEIHTTDTGTDRLRRRCGDRSKSLVARLKRLFS